MNRAAMLACALLFSAAAGAQTGNLAEEAKTTGAARRVYAEQPKPVAGLGEMITTSDLIFTGRVVDEKPRLAADGALVVTDYTIEVSEVLKDKEALTAAGKRLTVTQPGGKLNLGGAPIVVEAPHYPPLPWILPHLFFLVKAKVGGLEFRGGPQGVFEIREGKVRAQARGGESSPFTARYDGTKLEEFAAWVRDMLAPVKKP